MAPCSTQENNLSGVLNNLGSSQPPRPKYWGGGGGGLTPPPSRSAALANKCVSSVKTDEWLKSIIKIDDIYHKPFLGRTLQKVKKTICHLIQKVYKLSKSHIYNLCPTCNDQVFIFFLSVQFSTIQELKSKMETTDIIYKINISPMPPHLKQLTFLVANFHHFLEEQV